MAKLNYENVERGNYEMLPLEMKKKGKFCYYTESKIPLKEIRAIPNTSRGARSNHIEDFVSIYEANKNIEDHFGDLVNIADETKTIHQERICGLGICLYDDIACVDVDSCINENGNFSPLAQELLEVLDSYSEISPSKTGIHIFFKYNPNEWKKEDFNLKYYSNNSSRGGFECYFPSVTPKYITLTGNRIQSTSRELALISRNTLEPLLVKYNKKTESQQEPISIDYTKESKELKEDIESIKRGLKKDKEFLRLWNRNLNEKEIDESSLDLSIFNKIVYWSNKDYGASVEALKESPFFKGKDEAHQLKWNRNDYLQKTFFEAMRKCRSTAKEDFEEWKRKNHDRGKEVNISIDDFIENHLKDIPQDEQEGHMEQIQQEPSTEEVQQEQPVEFDSMFYKVGEFLEDLWNNKFKRIPTGFKNLDKYLNGGIALQSVVTLGGGTSIGKTSFALNIAMNMAKTNPIIFVPLEMTNEQMFTKALSNLTKEKGWELSSEDIINKKLGIEQAKKIVEENSHLKNLYFVKPKKIDIESIMNLVNNYREKLIAKGENEPVVFIDYLQYIRANGKDDEARTIKKIQSLLKDYVFKNNALLFLLIANSRGLEGARTTISSGRDSSDIEYSSDYNLQLNFAQWEYNEPQGEKKLQELDSRRILCSQEPRKISLTIHKNRLGACGGIFDFKFYSTYNYFCEARFNPEELKSSIQRAKQSKS